MKKINNLTFGGIQQKLFNLVLIMLLLVMAAYSAVIVYQMNNLSTLVSESSKSQKESISAIAGGTMDSVISNTMTSSTQMQAWIADDMFADTVDVISILGDYTQKVLSDPGSFSAKEVPLPDASLDGSISVQLLSEEGVDFKDPSVARKIGLLGNLSEMMTSLYANAEVDSCYVATPEGIMVLVDDHSASKFDEDGNQIPIPIHERDWYKGASETGKLYFTDVVTDIFTGKICIMCSIPVYVNNELAAVIGADLFLDNMAAYVNNAADDGSFVCIINDKGHIVFSPVQEGEFKVTGGEKDLRESDNAGLASFINSALQNSTEVSTVEMDDDVYYLCGAPVHTVEWAVINGVSKTLADTPTVMMEDQYDSILSETVASFRSTIKKSQRTIVILLLAVMVMALGGALVLSGRIVKPLETMTKRITSLGGEDLQFKMEDTYRTGDEIEVLAESFAVLSARTLQYVDQVRTVTAEKERIGAELNMATAIQASQLPRLFPAFPSRPEFDLYASMNPAKEVGGDFYDFFLIDNDHIGLVMADVSGKGVPAALFMMVSRVLIKSHLQNGESPGEALENVNNQLCESNEADLFVTVWLAVVEISTGKGVAANAGHEHPAIARSGGKFELNVYPHSPAVAVMEGIPFREHEFELNAGDRIFVYTDGVPEATNASSELFGTDRMLEALNRDPSASPEEIIANVTSGIAEFVGDAEQFDDTTMLCLYYKGTAAKA